jgi:glycosyltransferase involved in cell wall biosynthesis
MGRKKSKIWILQPGIAPYRIPLFERISDSQSIDLTVILLCEQVPFQPWNIDYKNLPFRTILSKGMNMVVNDNRIVHDRQIQFSFPLIWLLMKHRPDVVICSGFMISSLITYIVGKMLGIPYIIWNEGTKYTDSDLSALKLFLRKRMAKSSKAFIIAGSLAREYVESLLDSKSSARFFLSYNCVDSRQFMTETSGDAIETLKHRFSPRNLLFVGRLIETKGIKELMVAYRHLVHIDGQEDLGLILLGEGRLQEYIEDFARENGLRNIFIEGFVPQNRIKYYYALADVFVLLSLSDPNPLVIFEALAAGVPIVCSYRAGNARDFIVDGENGFSVDPYNHDETVDKLRKALTKIDPYRARQVSRNLLERANYIASARGFLDAIDAVKMRSA